MRAGSGQGGIERALGHQPVAEHGAAQRFDGRGQIIANRIARADADQERPVLHGAEPGGAGQGEELAAKRDVGADGGESTDKRGAQRVPSRMRRMAIERRHVGLLHGDDAAGLGETHRLTQQLLRLARGAGNEAEMDEVEAPGRERGAIGVALHEIGIGSGAAAAMLDEHGIGIEPGDVTAGADARAEQSRDAAGPAAEIEATPAFGNADPLQHGRAIGRHRRALAIKSFDLAVAPLERVMTGALAHAARRTTKAPGHQEEFFANPLCVFVSLWFHHRMTQRLYRAIGLMSGTSLDGIDVAFIESDGESDVTTGPWLTMPYDHALREALRGTLGGKGAVAEVERALTEAHAAAVKRLIERHAIEGVELIGFHGHTIVHNPAQRRTWQIGDGALLAQLTGIDVVCDFRSADVAAGGEGAPFAPIFHAALGARLERPLAVINIGGVANVTWIGEGSGKDEVALLAFDTGPGNAPIDDWVRAKTGAAADYDGALAASGKVDEAQVARFLRHPYFARKPPKSLDRDDFASFKLGDLSTEDGAATLTAISAAAIARSFAHLPAPPRRVLVTGGGRHNPVLMQMLAARLGRPVAPVEAVGWEGDAIEAQAFAYLALRARAGLPLSFPGTTGVARPTTGGVLHRAVR
jgi:anhydro-N-acetylmuramic acid kinase